MRTVSELKVYETVNHLSVDTKKPPKVINTKHSETWLKSIDLDKLMLKSNVHTHS